MSGFSDLSPRDKVMQEKDRAETRILDAIREFSKNTGLDVCDITLYGRREFSKDLRRQKDIVTFTIDSVRLDAKITE